MTAGKTIDLTRWTFFGKVMPLLFNMLFSLVITFLPMSKHLLVSPSAVILEPPPKKSVTVSTVSPSICHLKKSLNLVSTQRLVLKPIFLSKCLLISWLQSPSAVILEPRKIKSATVSPSVCHEVMYVYRHKYIQTEIGEMN